MSVLNRTALATALLVAAPLASAADIDTNFEVSITIVNSCTIEATDMAFLDTNVDVDRTATATVTVDCSSPNDTFDIALNGGGSGDITGRQLSDGTNTINYNLYTDATHDTVWGDGTNGVVVGSISTGEDQDFTVYGLIPAQTAKPEGTYTDTIVATVTY
jgi:spore coat protein U-like protein